MILQELQQENKAILIFHHISRSCALRAVGVWQERPRARGQLVEMDAPAVQADTSNRADCWHSFWLKKKGVSQQTTYRRANARGGAANMFGSP